MTRYWEPGTQYNYDDVVQYEGHRYKIIQPHRSQGDWTPPITPALWGRLSDEDDGGCQQPNYQQGQQQQYQQQQPQYSQQTPQYSQQTPQYSQQTPQYSQQTPQYQDDKQNEQGPEGQKHWYEDESTKKKLEIGAGVTGAAALLAGGLFAYKKHEEHKEEGKARVWARDNWIDEARTRTEALHRQGPSGPAVWALTRGKSIPNHAIVVGQEHGRNLYSSRSFYEGALVIGKASEAFHKGSVIGYADAEIEVEEYEVLVGDVNRLKWVSASGKLNVGALGHRPVEGGHEKNGTPVYIARAPHKDGTHPGKVSEELDGAYITYGGKEKVIKEYQVLCYN